MHSQLPSNRGYLPLATLPLASLLLSGLLAGDPVAQATGRWDLPSTIPQFFGYGNGPGYHAPRVRLPASTHPSRAYRSGNWGYQGNLMEDEFLPATSPHETSKINTANSPTVDIAMIPIPRTENSVPQTESGHPAEVMSQPPVNFQESQASPSRYPSVPDSWQAPVRLPYVTDLESESESLVLFPPGIPNLEKPQTSRIEQLDEIKPPAPDTSQKNPLFSAPPLPAHQG